MNEKNTLSAGAIAVLVFMKANNEVLTANKIKAGGVNVNSSQLVKLVRDGYIDNVGKIKLVCNECGTSRVVNGYKVNENGLAYKTE